MTHWSTRSLARAASAQRITPRIAHSTVSLILREAELQPHRSRSWRTPTLDAAFRTHAAQVLWCYERAADLAAREEVVLCLDEKPNFQVLSRRRPTRPLRRGRIEQREFEYVRHGVVNPLVALVVHSGRMRGWCLEANDSLHLRRALPHVLRPYRSARRVHLIWDGGPSHTARDTRDWLHAHFPRVRLVFTPAHASWLNQAELLLRAFVARYLERGEWASREDFVEHFDASWPEYNRLYAHPFDWSWTRHQMRQWFDRHAP